MKKVYILYNPKAGKGTGEVETKKLDAVMNQYNLVYQDITKIESYADFVANMEKVSIILVSGGDGTLSRFATDINGLTIENPIYYYATGSGNDFLKDLGYVKGEKPFPINEYIENLPIINVEDREHAFINGVGGGLDAYACVEGNKAHLKGKKGNYVLSAIKGILYDYKPTNATVLVDGKEYAFKNVWFASAMRGRYFGGGIMLAPNQDRTKDSLSIVIVHKVSRPRLLTVIPGAFEGKHVKYTQFVTIIQGNDVKVTFDRPVALQVDGETLPETTHFDVMLKSKVLK